MQIDIYTLAHAGELALVGAQLYNQQIEGIPFCYPIDPAQFLAALEQPCRDLADERLVICSVSGQIVGYAHVARQVARQNAPLDPETGQIRSLLYARGQRPVGQALLAAAETHLRTEGLARLGAFYYAYPFHRFGAPCQSEQLNHIRALLQGCGYSMADGWLFLVLESMEGPAKQPPPGLEMEWTSVQGSGKRPGGSLRVYRQGREIGHCEAGCGGDFCVHPDAQESLFIRHIGVEEEAMGQGIGHFLLQQVVARSAPEGYRRCLLYTNLANARAQSFYAHWGFRVVDSMYRFGRDLGGKLDAVPHRRLSGTIVAPKADGIYQIELTDGRQITGFKSEAMGQFGIVVGVGDKVVVEQFETSVGRIVWRE
ncbi:MAG: GNAT family N-acetyltransferase [Candidatus Latescibacteria bacterium]|nr:GNAT family N-acetyltransferase [Candidatus Latescibacterota bacterium]